MQDPGRGRCIGGFATYARYSGTAHQSETARMPPPPLAHYRRALETYIDAKDNTRANRIAEAFAPDAVLTISLATSNIAFPARTVGTDAIAKTLVTDFGAQYAQCRTYYVCNSLAVENGTIDALPWRAIAQAQPTVSATATRAARP